MPEHFDKLSAAPKRPLKVFLCHAHSDQTRVHDLYNRLTKDGLDVWLDKEKLLAGSDWEFEIRAAVRNSDVVIVCHSNQFNQRGFRQKEVKIALEEAELLPKGEIFIIPARLEECEVLDDLQRWHWVDLFEDDGYERLIRALRARADKIDATLQIKKNLFPKINIQPNKIPKSNVKTQISKNSRRIFGVFILIVVGLSAIFGLPPLLKFESLEPTFIATNTSILRTFTSIATNNTSAVTITPTKPITTATPTQLPAEITDEFGVDMVLVPVGEFVIGNNSSAFLDEKPSQTIFLDSFYIDKFEVTNTLYYDCVNAGICQLVISSYNPQNPIVNVDWTMAKNYCEVWRNGYLPTEAEWEKSARGTSEQIYPWGNTLGCEYANYFKERVYDSFFKVYRNRYCVGHATVVGSYELGKSIYGVYDNSGNVSEWTNSPYVSYGSNYVIENGELGSPVVVRGGSWVSTKDKITTYARFSVDPLTTSDRIGFRCAKDANP